MLTEEFCLIYGDVPLQKVGVNLPPFLGFPTEGGLDLMACSRRIKSGKRKNGNQRGEKLGKQHRDQVMKANVLCVPRYDVMLGAPHLRGLLPPNPRLQFHHGKFTRHAPIGGHSPRRPASTLKVVRSRKARRD